jgi:hypothetical protein
MDQWDRFAAGADRDLEALGYQDTLDVYAPTETYDEADGYVTTYPDQPTRVVDAELATPQADADRQPQGTTSEADLVIRVAEPRDQWTGYGVDGEATPRVVDRSTGVRYQIVDVASEHNGLLRLEAVEY